MHYLPHFLIVLRLLMGVALVVLSYLDISSFALWAIILLTAGLVSDILDGIVARKLGISTTLMRRMDSSVDQVFFICAAVAIWHHCPLFFGNHLPALAWLFGAEALTYLVSYVKFHKEVATHAISSKVWTLVLFATLIDITTNCESKAWFTVCILGGVITRLEIVGILILLREWTNDVPSIWHAWQLRQGKTITRRKLFNG